MSVVSEFREFIERGNVIDLAVAVVVGAAFSQVVDSFTTNIFGGILGAMGGQPSIGDLTLTIGDGVIRWGAFVDSILNFVVVAFAIFLVVKAINAAQSVTRKQSDAAEVAAEQTEIELLREIRDALHKS